KEPDGYLGWPKGDGGGGDVKEYTADSLVGEAMLLRPVVVMATQVRRSPALFPQWQSWAQSALDFAEQNFKKWESRGCWREVKEGGLWVVPGWGIDRNTGGWSEGYKDRLNTGFSNPANKQNQIARWMLALFDATQNPIYRERAEKWFQLMK